MDKRYFRIVPATQADAEQLKWLLTNKTFYPEATSAPALPGSYVDGFDYRQFFIVVGFEKNGSAIVFTRSEYTEIEFGTDVIPTDDWTDRYYLSVAPTIESIPDYTEIVNGHNTQTDIRSFLSYDYQLFNNK